MKAYEIIKLACIFSDNESLSDKISEETMADYENSFTDKEKTSLNRHLDCLQSVQDEIITEYKPLIFEECFKSENFKILTSAFSKPVFEILSIKDLKGRKVKFKVYPNYIMAFSGMVEIRYSYKCTLENMSSEVETDIPPRILAYGVAREYLLRQGLYDDADIYENRFKDGLKIILKKKTDTQIPGRRWL